MTSDSGDLNTWLLSGGAGPGDGLLDDIPPSRPRSMASVLGSRNDEDKRTESLRNKCYAHTLLWLFTMVMGASPFLFGFHTAFTSQTLQEMDSKFALNSFTGAFVGQLGLGAVLGALVAGPMADRYGRVRVCMLNSLVIVAGTVAMILASGVVVLFIGRTLIGMAIGSASLVVPLYLSEIAPTSSRGSLVATYALCINLGTLFAYMMGVMQTVDETFWHYMLCFAILPALLQMVGLVFFPESPQFLVKAGRIAKAKKTLKRLRRLDDDEVEAEVDDMQSMLSESVGTWGDLVDNRSIKAFGISLGLAVLQQMCGYWVLISYATEFWKLTRISWNSAVLMSVGFGVNVFGGVLCLLLIDLVGRRKLLLYTLLPMWLSLLALTLYLVADEFWDGINSYFTLVPALSLSAFVLCYSVGVGPITWVIIPEIFALRVRGSAMAVCMAANWTCYYIVAVPFPILTEHTPISITFGVFTMTTLLGHIFVYVAVPETKDMSFIQIHKSLVGHYNYIGRTFRLGDTDVSDQDQDDDSLPQAGET